MTGAVRRVSRHATALFVAALLILLCSFYWPFLSGSQSFHTFDLSVVWQPLLTYTGERLRNGAWPLWNPYVISGIPQCFSPTILYFPNLIFAALDFSAGLALILVLQQLIAGIGMYLLVTDSRWGRGAAIFAGTAFALAGIMFALQVTYTIQGPIAWFPIAFWAYRRIDRANFRSRCQWSFITALFMGLMIAAGMAEVWLPGLLILTSYAIYAFARQRTAYGVTILAMQFCSLLFGILFSAGVLLPTSEWARISIRAQGLPMSDILACAASWYDVLCVVAMQPLGDLYNYNKFVPLIAAWSDANHDKYVPYYASAYVGPIVLTLAIWGFSDKRWRSRWFVLAIIMAALIGALGSHTPVDPGIIRQFHLTAFRYPMKLLPWVVFGLTFAAARGYLLLSQTGKSFAHFITLQLWSLCLGLSAAVLYAHTTQHLADFLTLIHASIFDIQDPDYLEALAQIAGGIVFTSITGILACLIWSLRRRERLSELAAGAIVTALTVCCLMLNAWLFNMHGAPPKLYKSRSWLADQINAAASKMNLQGMHRACLFMAVPPLREKFASEPAYTVAEYQRNLLKGAVNVNFRIGSTHSAINGQTADNRKLWSNAARLYEARNEIPLAILCQLTGTQFVCTNLLIVYHERAMPFPALNPQFFVQIAGSAGFNAVLYKVLNAMPRAYFASHPVPVTHQMAMDEIMNPAKFNFSPGATTLIEAPNDIVQTNSSAPSSSAVHSQESARVIVDEPEHIVIETDATSAHFVVLTDQTYPGWIATVDGRTTTIYTANAIMRSVPVTAGKHRVEFHYSPNSLWIGLAIAVVSMFLAAVLLLVAPRFKAANTTAS